MPQPLAESGAHHGNCHKWPRCEQDCKHFAEGDRPVQLSGMAFTILLYLSQYDDDDDDDDDDLCHCTKGPRLGIGI